MGPDSLPDSVAVFDERIVNGKLVLFLEQTAGLGQARLVDQVHPIHSFALCTHSIRLFDC
jgi:hypothetical protein